jgi:hypothetical protein
LKSGQSNSSFVIPSKSVNIAEIGIDSFFKSTDAPSAAKLIQFSKIPIFL